MKILIVDDEIEACDYLKISLLKININCEILPFAHNTDEAEALIKLYQPDALFIDINMPNETGIDFIKRFKNINFEIVFITAYDEYAVKAFRLNALDYLLKPLDLVDLNNVFKKLCLYIENKHLLESNRIANTMEFPLISKEQTKNIILRSLQKHEVVSFDKILFLEAEGAYTKFHVLNNSNKINIILTSYNLTNYEDLIPVFFYRIHKSYIVNCKYVVRIINNNQVQLQFNFLLPVARRRMIDFQKKLLLNG